MQETDVHMCEAFIYGRDFRSALSSRFLYIIVIIKQGTLFIVIFMFKCHYNLFLCFI